MYVNYQVMTQQHHQSTLRLAVLVDEASASASGVTLIGGPSDESVLCALERRNPLLTIAFWHHKRMMA